MSVMLAVDDDGNQLTYKGSVLKRGQNNLFNHCHKCTEPKNIIKKTAHLRSIAAMHGEGFSMPEALEQAEPQARAGAGGSRRDIDDALHHLVYLKLIENIRKGATLPPWPKPSSMMGTTWRTWRACSKPRWPLSWRSLLACDGYPCFV